MHTTAKLFIYKMIVVRPFLQKTAQPSDYHNRYFMLYKKDIVTEIHLPNPQWQIMLGQCLRKLAGRYLDNEIREPKAFGLLGGTLEGNLLVLKHVIPLMKNARHQDCNKSYMDGTMEQHAVSSETPLEQRGWVADPAELDMALKDFQAKGIRIVGTYHMHRIAWEHDHARDTPTKLDMILGKDSRLFMFIISMVKPDRPLLRAFFEGDSDQEVRVNIDY